ncbi:MAG: M15 family metallopeptidase [Gammaproteobacteria bacterium]|nr:M15 family metallopeptidase [Gammaproteobacteria bacterium]MDH5592846.1 M15 family metallopeptidase [Gammaproteobacteria bacterium]MDH5614233.1 M15 family metallopeptidase [Gammaproteobacteria bacterium]
MKRRTLIKAIPLSLLAAAGGVSIWRDHAISKTAISLSEDNSYDQHINLNDLLGEDLFIKDNLEKPEQKIAKTTEIIIKDDEFKRLKSVVAHLQRVQNQVGYANFNLLGFDEMIRIGRNFSSVGSFTRAELDFFEYIFTADAKAYGFFGDKVIDNISSVIPEREIKKIARTGHYLFKGQSIEKYNRVRKDVGNSLVLTSGIRSVVKQTYLFLSKAIETDGNLSMASYSLAPPGHSYHGIGDFDVGKVGYGHKNFTADFSHTDEYKRLTDLGYVAIRYVNGNPFGVRFEPWHIKVV